MDTISALSKLDLIYTVLKSIKSLRLISDTEQPFIGHMAPLPITSMVTTNVCSRAIQNVFYHINYSCFKRQKCWKTHTDTHLSAHTLTHGFYIPLNHTVIAATCINIPAGGLTTGWHTDLRSDTSVTPHTNPQRQPFTVNFVFNTCQWRRKLGNIEATI